MKNSIFVRIMLAGLLPAILIFSFVLILAGNMVYRAILDSETKTAILRAEQATQLLVSKLVYLPDLLNVTGELLLRIDKKSPGAEEEADEILRLFVNSHPDIHNAWFAFEPGMFRENARFTKSYVKYAPEVVKEVFDMDDEILDDPKASPWYNVSLTTGSLYFASMDLYDYGDGRGPVQTASATYPVVESDGRVIGCVGFDILFDNTAFQSISDMEIAGERKILLLMEDGTITYSADGQETGALISDYPFENMEEIVQTINSGGSLEQNSYSPFFNKKSLICLYPIIIEKDSAHPYFYMDMPLDALHRGSWRSMLMIAGGSTACLLITAFLLFIIAGNIVKPIRAITASANKIADGDMAAAAAFSAADENKNSHDEVQRMSVAIKKMLTQLEEAQKLKVQTLELQHKKEAAEAQAQARGDFLARMSHEIRTPLNAIIGMTELILREEIPPLVYEHALGIKAAGNNLLSIINDILDYSKIESGKLKIIPAEYIFASLINDVINIIRIRTTEKPVLFVVNLNSRIPNKLIGDEVRIRQILLNLLGNAVKYTNEGFIALTVDGEMRENNTFILRMEVADSGIGVKPENIDELFLTFVQVDASANKGVQGSGLGLPIAQNLCQAMGGEIHVSSEYGRGSTFSVSIPQKFTEYERFAVVDHPREKKVLLYEPRKIYADSVAGSIDNLGVECTLAQDQKQFCEALISRNYSFVFVASFLFENAKDILAELQLSPTIVSLGEYGEITAEKNVKNIAMPAQAISIANILNDVTDNAGYSEYVDISINFSAPAARVLLVDDIATNLKVTAGLMAPYNMRIDTCMSGEAAIEMVQSAAYDLVFMDHMMPGMDGVEATKHIRELPGEYYANLPIVALTANAISGVREMFMQNGMNDFLAKPIEMSKLNAVLEQWIPSEKQEKQSQRIVQHACAPFEIEGIDVQSGLIATEGDANQYLTTLSLFHKDSLEKMGQIRECLAKEDLRLFTTYVHALKGALASIGARELAQVAQKLESAGQEGQMALLEQKTDIFLHKLENLLLHIDKVMADSMKKARAGEALDQDLLIRLRRSLDEMDAVTMGEMIRQLQGQDLSTELRETIENIYQNILLFEYEAAQAIIDGLLKG